LSVVATAPLAPAPPFEALRSCVLAAVLGVLGISTTIVLAMLLYRSSLRVPLNYNEGWNAYWAQRAAMGQAIYPPPGAMVFNNYPPLSFLLIGGLSRLGIDVWILGRIVAWLSFAGCAALIHTVLRARGTGRAGAALGALMFCALMALNYGTYLGMYDPQLTAHCGMLAGLYVLVRAGRPTRRSVMLAAVVIVASGFLKHNLIALPLSITAWLALYRRDLLACWVVAAATSLAIGFLLCLAAFGTDFLAGLETPRASDGYDIYLKLMRWLPPLVLPMLVTLSPLVRPKREPIGVLLALFALIAFLAGCLELAGYGVVYNALFELVIAASLGVGYRLGRGTLGSWVMLATAASVAWSGGLAATAWIAYRHDWMTARQQRVADAQRSAEIIAAQPGPALCEDLLLCYWAGKPFSVDIFNYLQAVRSGRRDGRELQSQIEQGRFGAIQLNPIDNRTPASLQAAIHQHYEPVAGVPDLFVRQAATANRLAANPLSPHPAVPVR
jgi:hypothetical protein